MVRGDIESRECRSRMARRCSRLPYCIKLYPTNLSRAAAKQPGRSRLRTRAPSAFYSKKNREAPHDLIRWSICSMYVWTYSAASVHSASPQIRRRPRLVPPDKLRLRRGQIRPNRTTKVKVERHPYRAAAKKTRKAQRRRQRDLRRGSYLAVLPSRCGIYAGRERESWLAEWP
jgi:hypothetical protein